MERRESVRRRCKGRARGSMESGAVSREFEAAPARRRCAVSAAATTARRCRAVDRSLAGVAEWQTRRTQNPVFERACGFKSHLRHLVEDPRDGAGSPLRVSGMRERRSPCGFFDRQDQGHHRRPFPDHREPDRPGHAVGVAPARPRPLPDRVLRSAVAGPAFAPMPSSRSARKSSVRTFGRRRTSASITSRNRCGGSRVGSLRKPRKQDRACRSAIVRPARPVAGVFEASAGSARKLRPPCPRATLQRWSRASCKTRPQSRPSTRVERATRPNV